MSKKLRLIYGLILLSMSAAMLFVVFLVWKNSHWSIAFLVTGLYLEVSFFPILEKQIKFICGVSK